MRPHALLVIALVLAGCLDSPRAQPGAEGAVLAYADAAEPAGPNRTILALREGGAATRVTYLFDGSWTPRLAPGIDMDEDVARRLFAPTPARERGGLVVRVEEGAVDAAAMEALQPFLDGEWPAGFQPPDAPHPWYRPTLFVRADPKAVAEAPPDAPDHLGPELAPLAELVGVFDAIQRSFVARSTQEADLPFQAAWEGCLRATTNATPSAVRAGETVEVRAEVSNCGASEAVLDPAACARPPTATVQVSSSMGVMLAALPWSESPSAAFALDLVCRGDADAIRIAPGSNATLVRRWNGTFAACGLDGACEYRVAPGGPYAFFTFASGQQETAPASVTVVGLDAPTTRVLLSRERAWVNTTSQQPIEGFFGPHCAPVHYTTSPPTVTIWHSGEEPALSPGVVVRDWRGSERPEHVATFSADRLDLLHVVEGGVALASPFERERALANVTLDGDAFVVDGTRIAPGERHAFRVVRSVEREAGTYETTSEIELENLGEAAVLWQQAGGCA